MKITEIIVICETDLEVNRILSLFGHVNLCVNLPHGIYTMYYHGEIKYTGGQGDCNKHDYDHYIDSKEIKSLEDLKIMYESIKFNLI